LFEKETLRKEMLRRKHSGNNKKISAIKDNVSGMAS